MELGAHLMPMPWQAITWFGSFAVALSLATWMRIQGFDWPATSLAILVTVLILPFAIGQCWTAFAARRAKDSPRGQRAQRWPDGELVSGLQTLPTDALQILIDYSALVEGFPDCVIDSSWLPANKEQMKGALKLSWLQATNAVARNWVETGWYLLSHFQDDVGEIPITVFRTSPKNIPIGRHIDFIEGQGRWHQRMVADGEVLMHELDQFKQAVALKLRS
jgi:hypothetical protein